MKGLIISSLFLIFVLCSFCIPDDHAIYISVIAIEHAEKSDLTTIQFKIFSDDLHDALHLEYQQNHPIDSVLTSDYQINIKQYLNQHFRIDVNNQALKITDISTEIQGDATFIEAIVHAPVEWNTTEIHTDILLDLFPTQQNIVQLDNCKEKRFAKLSKNKMEAVFQF